MGWPLPAGWFGKPDPQPDMTEAQRAFDKVRRSPEYAEHWRQMKENLEPMLAAERAHTDAFVAEIKRKVERVHAMRDLQSRNDVW